MDRKGIIAVVLSIIILVGWQFKTQKEIKEWREAHPQAKQTAQTTQTSPSLSASAAAVPSPSATPTAPALASTPEPTEPAVPEQKQTVATASAQYTFTNLGGGIESIRLLHHEGASGARPARSASDQEKGQSTDESRQGDKDAKVILNEHASYPIGALLSEPGDADRKPYTVTVKGNQVICERTDANGLTITKTFTLPTEMKGAAEYSVHLDIAFSNRGSAPVEHSGYYLFAGAIEPIHSSEYPNSTGVDWFHGDKATFIDVLWFNAKSVPLTGIQRAPAKTQYLETPGSGVAWAGVRNQYFTSLLSAPKTPGTGVWATRFPIQIETKEMHGIQAALGMPGFKLGPQETASQQVVVYAGPREYSRLAELGHGEQEMMNFGFFKIISIFLLRSMNWLQGWIGSYALAIILLTFVVRGILWPIQGRATKSMKRMQLLQPKMAELKEKYKDDPAKMNQELMKLYKVYGINPITGCLPMFIQIPIFFGFYSMLGAAVELRNSHFLWVHDLSQPDTVFHLWGIPVNILPLLMAATMIAQMRLTPRSGDPTQQRLLLFMPLIFVVFTYNYASALALYYTVQNLLSIVQLYVMRNEGAPALAKEGTPRRAKRR